MNFGNTASSFQKIEQGQGQVSRYNTIGKQGSRNSVSVMFSNLHQNEIYHGSMDLVQKHGSGSTEARKHGSTEAQKHGSTEARKHGSTEAQMHGSMAAKKRRSTLARMHRCIKALEAHCMMKGSTEALMHGSMEILTFIKYLMLFYFAHAN